MVMGMLEFNDAQQQRYQRAYDITRYLLTQLHIFPATEQDRQQMLELDEMETGYPRMTVEQVYDVVKVMAHLAANERKLEDFAAPEYYFYSPQFRQQKARVIELLRSGIGQEHSSHPASWRVIQGKLSQLIRMKIFDNAQAGPLAYQQLTTPGQVSIIDLSDTDSPQINNLVIAEFLRGLMEAQNNHYNEVTRGTQGEAATLLRRTMVIIEEAHEFLSAERIRQMPVLYQQVARIARRGRKRWLGLAFVTQLPQHLPDEVLGLINNYILHKIGDANVISRLKRSLGVVDDSLWQRLPNLAPGQALVSMSSFARPLLINIDPTPCKLRMVE
jgi:DNA helicase HerA-like ATPase